MRDAFFSKTALPLLNFILPPRCPACKARVTEQGNLCGACWGALTVIGSPSCSLCDFPFSIDQAALGGTEFGLCAACLANPPEPGRILTALAYDDVSKNMILRLKYGRLYAMARPLGQLMVARLVSSRVLVEKTAKKILLVPIPLHRKRMASRRFNQSLALARVIQNRGQDLFGDRDWVLMPSLLERKVQSASQSGLSRKGRYRNLAGAFSFDEKTIPDFSDSLVILVDDVFTTGATLQSAARVLRRAGALDIVGLAAARAPGPR